MLSARSCIWRTASAGSLAVGLVVAAGCSGSGGAPASPSPSASASVPAPTPPTPTAGSATDLCAAPNAPARQPSLILCLGGAVSGETLVPDRDATTCTATPGGGLTGTWVTLVNSIEIRLEIEADTPGDQAGTVVTVVQPARGKSWSSLAATGRFGTVSVAPDRSGSLDVTLPPRDLVSGADVAGPPLRVHGTFRCPAV